ncbi:hypothetical protein QUF84_03905 [Fictibacillus enclensis]|uniref:hypothetical protein n=1 Tax=Fictibacillus enclensis TaxID=1017270 RepID=UPI0025A22DAC|nr:hypothetical protein [Fictibacillus enclensis]MDM5336377.1 hypothetical protein [Fictibacillus enclensis]
MGFLKSFGKGAGEFIGGVTGGLIKGVGEIAGSDFIKEVGVGLKQSTEFAGKQLGNLAEGAWDVGSGLVNKNDAKIEKGFADIGEGVSSTAKAVGQGITSTVKSVGNVAGGIIEGDENRWKQGLRDVGKTVAVGVLGVSILDVVDVVDINGNEGVFDNDGNNGGNIDTGGMAMGDATQSYNEGEIEATDSQEYTKEVNPNSHGVAPHFVEGYYRADGTFVEGYWRDGDGDTDVNRTAEQEGGWNQGNPAYRIPTDKA